MTLIDANVILDILTKDEIWSPWSVGALAEAQQAGELLINDVIYAEVSVRFESVTALEERLERLKLRHQPLPRSALFAAGKVFKRYRNTQKERSSLLPDFFIGAHAEALDCPLLTRDVRRYRTYFPAVRLITP